MKNIPRIAIIEDDKDINNLIAYNLRKEGFFVEQIYDGLKAKEVLKEQLFNIVIIDIMLPGADGFELCQTLKHRSDAFGTFIIVISVKNAVEDKLYAHILGANCYFTKPFSLRELIKTAREFAGLVGREYVVSGR